MQSQDHPPSLASPSQGPSKGLGAPSHGSKAPYPSRWNVRYGTDETVQLRSGVTGPALHRRFSNSLQLLRTLYASECGAAFAPHHGDPSTYRACLGKYASSLLQRSVRATLSGVQRTLSERPTICCRTVAEQATVDGVLLATRPTQPWCQLEHQE